MLGREVTKLVKGYQDAGVYSTEFNGSGLASGLYFYRLKAGSFVKARKMMLLR